MELIWWTCIPNTTLARSENAPLFSYRGWALYPLILVLCQSTRALAVTGISSLPFTFFALGPVFPRRCLWWAFWFQKSVQLTFSSCLSIFLSGELPMVVAGCSSNFLPRSVDAVSSFVFTFFLSESSSSDTPSSLGRMVFAWRIATRCHRT